MDSDLTVVITPDQRVIGPFATAERGREWARLHGCNLIVTLERPTWEHEAMLASSAAIQR